MIKIIFKLIIPLIGLQFFFAPPAEAARLLDRAGKGTVMVLFVSKKGGEDYLDYAENIMKERLKNSGFMVMNPEMAEKVKKDRLLLEAIKNANASAMAKISTSYGADLLLRGSVGVESREKLGSWEGNASLSVIAIDTVTGEEVETLFSDPMGSVDNPAPLEDSSIAAKQMAIKKGIDNLMQKMGVASEVISQLTTIAPQFYAAMPTGAGVVRGIAFTPDSRVVAAACKGGVKIWDLNKGELLKTIDDYGGKATNLAFSKDGEILAITTTKGRIGLWQWRSAKLLRKLKDHDDGAWALDFSPDGRLLATGGGDGKIMIWDVTSGRRICEIRAHTEKLHSLAFDAQGRHVMTASDDLTIKFWDINTRKEVRAFAESMDKLVTAASSHDRSLIAYGAKTIDIDLLRKRRIDKKYIRLRDTGTGRDLFTFEGHTKDITAVAFFPGRRFLVSAAEDRTVKIWDVEKRGEVTSLEQTEDIYAVAVSRDGKWLAAGGSELLLWKLK
jgi:hypothetical protein